MKRYVVGFMFDLSQTSVLLIEKKRPEWQKDKFNGVGGHIETSDISVQYAMMREFHEETGIATIPLDWIVQFMLYAPEYELYVLSSRGDIRAAKSMTDEKVKVCDIYHLYHENVIPNLHWMIPLCLDPTIVPPISIRVNK